MFDYPARRPAPLKTQSPIDLQRRRVGGALGWTLVSGWLGVGCATRADLPESLAPLVDELLSKGGVPRFSSGEPSFGLPRGWTPYIVRRDRASTVYNIESQDGRMVLHARAEKSRSGLYAGVRIEPQATPWFSWSWRADEVHLAATIADDDAEDTPARIVLGFDGDMSKLPFRDRLFFEQVELFTGNKLPYATLVYAWDGQLAQEAVQTYLRSSRIKYKVVESGSGRTGQWLQYERNVVDDFQAMFGESPPGPISSVGLLTDSDDLNNSVEAWYGDMAFSERAQLSGASRSGTVMTALKSSISHQP